ncbi:MAG: nucleotide pyrophosphohydrolase [Planctomycetota bacterium]
MGIDVEQDSKAVERTNSEMTLRQAQAKVDQWIQTIGVRYFSELTNLAQLMEEVGELSRLMSRTYGDQSFKESDKNSSIQDELADILFVVICLANQTGIDLTDALSQNLRKKSVRDRERHQNNPKLH